MPESNALKALPYQGVSNTEAETLALGEALAAFLRPGMVVTLRGTLGAGKTVLCRGIARGLGIDPSRVRSPSFNLQFTYRGRCPVHHIDLYRLAEGSEVVDAGIEESLWDPEAISLVEWPERLGSIPLPSGVEVVLDGAGESRREVVVRLRERQE